MVLPTTRTVMGMTRALRALVMTITVLVAGKTHFRFFNFLEKIHLNDLLLLNFLPNIFRGEELIKASLQNDHILKSIPEKNWDVTYLCLQYDDND